LHLTEAASTSHPGPPAISTPLQWRIAYLSDSAFTTPVGHQGVAFVAASGDDGAQYAHYVPQVSPNVLDVGGTTLPPDQSGNPDRSQEVGWSLGSDAFNPYSASGGGISQYEAQPAYQQGIVRQSTLYRTSPDVAYDSDPSTGMPIYDSLSSPPGKPIAVFGGTSIAAPQWAALIAIADQLRAAAGEASLDGPTQLLPALYQIDQADPHSFQDITQGYNGYYAGPGYDLVTGLGTPNVQYLIPDLVNIDKSPAAPVTAYWTGDAGDNNWDNPGNWSLVDPAHSNVPQSVLPGPINDVVIDLAGATVNHALTRYDTVRSLTVAAPNVTLNLASGTLDLSGGGTLGTFQAGSGDVVNLMGGVLKSARVGAGTTITVPASATGLVDGGVLNGALQALAASTLELLGSWTNNGTITAAAGSTLVLGDYWAASVNDPAAASDAWVNHGTITAAGATVELGGWLSYTSANLNSLSLGTDWVALLGTLNNVNSTLTLTPRRTSNTGNWSFVGGRIDGGIIAATGGANLVADGPAFVLANNPTLDGVILDCPLDMSADGAHVAIVNGLTLNTDLSLSGYLAELQFNDGSALTAGTLVKSAVIHLKGSFSFLYNATSPNALLNNYPSQTPTIGQGITISGEANPSGLFGPFDNRGTIAQYTKGYMLVEELDNDGSVAVQSGTIYSTSQVFTGYYFVSGEPWGNNAGGTMTATQAGNLSLAGQWTNNGAVTAKGATLNLFDVWTNYGSITADPSSTVSLGDYSYNISGPIYAWKNAGVLAIDKGAALSLGDYFTTDEFQSGFQDRGVNLNLAKYPITLIGLLDNTAADNPVTAGTLTLDASTGALSMSNGAKIDGGTLTGTEPLDVTSGILQDVVVDDAINMPAGKYSPFLQVAGTWSITSRGSIMAAGSPFLSLFGTWVNNGSITVTAAGTVFLGDVGTNVSGRSDIWRNAGVLSIAAGSTIGLGGYFTTDEFQSGFQDRGVHFNLTQYTVWLSGLLNNSPADNPVTRGTLSLNASTGPLHLLGDYFPGNGVIEQGTITTTGADDLVAAGGALDNVTLDGTLDMSMVGPGVTILGTLTLNTDLNMSGAYTYLGFAGNSSVVVGPLVHSATIHMSGYSTTLYGDLQGSTTIGQGVIISGENSYSGIVGMITNLGTIEQNGPEPLRMFGGMVNDGSIQVSNGGTISFQGYLGGSFINAGTVTVGNGGTLSAQHGLTGTVDYVQSGGTTVVDGVLSAANVDIMGGLLTGSGTIQANVTNAGTVAPGDTFGTLTIQGNYAQTATGVLLIQIGGANAYGQLVVTGTATLGGTLDIALINGYTPALGTSFDILSFNQRSGDFATENGLNIGNGQFFVPVYENGDLVVTVN
jgi:hypothetical protein